MIGNGVRRRIFVPKRQEVREGCRNTRNEKHETFNHHITCCGDDQVRDVQDAGACITHNSKGR
jgi:hypothetical protein